MDATDMKQQVLRAIEQYAERLEPHGHPAMGEDEIRIHTASIIHKMIREMDMPENRANDEPPVIHRLTYGPGGQLVDNEGNVVCTMNLTGKLTLKQAFAYADMFIKATNET